MALYRVMVIAVGAAARLRRRTVIVARVRLALAVRRGRVAGTHVKGAHQRQSAVDHEPEQRQEWDGPQPLRDRAVQRMRRCSNSRRGGLQERKHQPFSKLMFW